MMARRNPYLTAGMRKMLIQLRDSEDQEVVFERGAGWWLGDSQVAGQVVKALLQICVLKDCSDTNSGMLRYTINGEGLRIINDPEYVPGIVRAKRTGKSVDV